MHMTDLGLCYCIYYINKQLVFKPVLVSSRLNYWRKLLENSFFIIQITGIYYFNKSKIIELFLLSWALLVTIPVFLRIITSKRSNAELLFIGGKSQPISVGKIVAVVKPEQSLELNPLLIKSVDGIIVDKLPRSTLRSIVLKSGNQPILKIINQKKILPIALWDLFEIENPCKAREVTYLAYYLIDGPLRKQIAKIITKDGIRLVQSSEEAKYVIDLNCMFGDSSAVFSNLEQTVSLIEKLKKPFLVFTPIQPISNTDAILYRAYEAVLMQFDNVKIVRIPFLVSYGINYPKKNGYTFWSDSYSINHYIARAHSRNEKGKIIEFIGRDYISSEDVMTILEKVGNL